MSLAQAELRMPLAPLLHRPVGDSLVPVELFTFTDWARFTAPHALHLSSSSSALWSAGVGARVNAAGFIFEFNAARPIRPASGWRFVVNFRPGF
jgi:hypothetical protein